MALNNEQPDIKKLENVTIEKKEHSIKVNGKSGQYLLITIHTRDNAEKIYDISFETKRQNQANNSLKTYRTRQPIQRQDCVPKPSLHFFMANRTIDKAYEILNEELDNIGIENEIFERIKKYCQTFIDNRTTDQQTLSLAQGYIRSHLTRSNKCPPIVTKTLSEQLGFPESLDSMGSQIRFFLKTSVFFATGVTAAAITYNKISSNHSNTFQPN